MMTSVLTPVPEEMKLYVSWVVWGRDGDRTKKEPYSPITGRLASAIDPSDWANYQQACEYAEKYNFAGIGFVLSNNDPYAFIDLDDPNSDPDIIRAQEAIFKNFPSYAELSPSGRGLHIIIKGHIPKGRRRNKIEIYSQARYMTMTGHPFRDTHILSCQEELIKLYESLGGEKEEAQIIDGLEEEVDEDSAIFDIACDAKNGDKFLDLWRGDWQPYYDSQSEADFALIDILAFYTRSRSQITRMFLNSNLGRRDKAKRQDYLDYMLNRCFDNMLPKVNLTYLQDQINAEIAKANIKSENPSNLFQKSESENGEKKSVYSFPPGIVGEIASFVYEQAKLPVKEVALTAALGLMSGIVGRAYNVSKTGLNQYYLLLAPTGIGKEGIDDGISAIMNEVKFISPTAMDFIGPANIASSQGLIRYMDDGFDSFVSIWGEFAHFMEQMVAKNASSNMLGLKRIILDLYNKSGRGKALRPSVYSDRANNTRIIQSPAFTFIGECTPEKFYSILNEDIIADGFLPRFLNIEYKGERPKFNYNHGQARPSQSLIDQVAALCANSQTLNSQNTTIEISFEKSSNQLLFDFEEFCRRQINDTSNDVKRQLWNRAHLKVLKLAGLIAVGINPYDPIIDEHCARWAINIVTHDCENITYRFERGEFGTSTTENAQIVKMVSVICRFLMTDYRDLTKTAKNIANCHLYHADKCVPYSYIYKKLVNNKLFKDDRYGPSAAIKKTLQNLIEVGDLDAVDRSTRQRRYNSITQCYMVKNTTLLSEGIRKGE